MALSQSKRNAIRHPIRWFMNTETEQPGEIPRKELTFFGLAHWGQSSLHSMAGGDRFFHFCTNVLMIKPETVGQLLGMTTLFDALNDPVAGSIIDGYRFKDGRKLLPWIKYTSPPIAIIAFLMFVNWNLPAGLTAAYAAVIYILWDVLYSFRDAAIWGMTATVSPHSDQRARSSQYADIGAMIGGLLPALTLPMLSGGGVFGLNQQQVYLMFAVVLCLGGGFMSLFAMGMNERVRSQPPAAEKGDKIHVVREFFLNISYLRHNHIILLLLASEVLAALSPQVTDIYIYQQLTYQVGGKEISAALLVTIFSAATMLPGAALKFFATKIADRVGGMKRIIVIARAAQVVTGLLGFFVGIKSVWSLALLLLIDGFNNLPGSLNSIAWRALVGDSVDYVEWKIDKRTEGITMSVRNFMAKLSNAIKRFIQGYTLGFLQFDASRVANKLPQNAHFQRWIWPAFRLGPVLGLAMSLIPLLLIKYPESLRLQVEAEMLERRALAAAKEEQES